MNAAHLLCLTIAAAGAAEPAPGTVFFNTSYPEASAVAVAGSPPRWLVVADNEVPHAVLYPLAELSARKTSPTLNAGISPEYGVDDVEAVTVFPWDPDGDGKPEATYHVFAGSGARTKNGNARPQRDALFAVTVKQEGTRPPVFSPAAEVKVNRSVRAQIRSLGAEHPSENWGPVLRDSTWRQGASPDGKDVNLTGAAGLNIEGLTVNRDASGLLLGLRSPLVEGRAVLIPLTNPVAALALGGSEPQPAALGTPQLLNLGGLGIRSIEWDAARKAYLIAAGSADDGKVFHFYTWNGDPGTDPDQVKTSSALAAAKLEPEGLTPVPGWKVVAVVGDGSPGSPWHAGMWVDFGPAPATAAGGKP